MSTQPKALVLADALEELDVQFSHTGLCGEAADELRRLHAVNANLLEALYQIRDLPEDSRIHYKVAQRAITKATGGEQ